MEVADLKPKKAAAPKLDCLGAGCPQSKRAPKAPSIGVQVVAPPHRRASGAATQKPASMGSTNPQTGAWEGSPESLLTERPGAAASFWERRPPKRAP